jgi:hypothetical protein
VFKWIDHKLRKPQQQPYNIGQNTGRENANFAMEQQLTAKPSSEKEKPIHRNIYIFGYRSQAEQHSFSVKILNGFCSECRHANSNRMMLVKNHTNALFGCSPNQCARILLKVKIDA